MADAPARQVAAERMKELFRCLESLPDFGAVVAALAAGKPATFDGVWGSSCALLADALLRHAPGPLVVVCPQVGDVDEFCEDFSLFSTHRPWRFPAWETEPGDQLLQDEAFGERLRTLKILSQQLHRLEKLNAETTTQVPSVRFSPLIVTSIQGLLQPAPNRETILANTRTLRSGDRMDVHDLLRWLAEHRFHSTTAVELPGEFSHRGGIIDLFAPDWDQPVRVELFDDEIESIRRFDVASQRSLEKLDAVELTMLRNGGVEFRVSDEQGDAAANQAGYLTDFLPLNAWILLVEPQQLHEAGSQYVTRLERPWNYHVLPQVMQRIANLSVATAASMSLGEAEHACHLPIETVERFSGDFTKVHDELDRIGEQSEVFVVAPTDAELSRLGEIFQTTKIAGAGKLHFTHGSLRAGFRLLREQVLIITGRELFNRSELRRTSRRHLGKAIDSFLDLNAGDLVVHLSHGIARFRGMKMLEKDESALEHLELEFDGGTKIFVPATKIELVQKYVGGTKSRPKLAKIGGQLWGKQKKAAEAAVVDMAAELLELQASRVSRVGIAFNPDSEWQQAFDASFPYVPTTDQSSAILAIKSDMERPRPMDRLLCGDVGFGKTEVAMRAAFKAVDSGYQVAVLVPTTILAEQHYHSFKERMAEFPFNIARLSRFCTSQEEREILHDLKTGKIDIVVGTHRLASADVQFLNLGAVIIDEEQRFGVDVKERLKTLRSMVDVLTMSATPIPRTLHMSLVGVRDISNLETPPSDRVAVETKVTRFNNEVIRHAVLRELNRGGQVFFVHNRVQDIEVVATKLKQIIPEATLRIGHGQMPVEELEEVMVDFIAGKFDLLLATTIVESGLDIPNANTIFIDEAERYGLADLHQLRGRVGRYKHHAFCYLLVDPHKHVTPNAAKRLRAIEEYSALGSGFAVAMRDLEIRGAGNLLGSQQSGHIATVGYELYCQLLENAVRSMKKMPPKLSIDVDIDLPGRAYLPADYIPDQRLKIDVYRRISRVASVQELGEMKEELHDRFGPSPPPVERMLALAELKMDAALWQVAAIRLEDKYMVFEYTLRPRIEQLSRLRKGKLRVVDEHSAYLTVPEQFANPEDLLRLAKSVLRPN